MRTQRTWWSGCCCGPAGRPRQIDLSVATPTLFGMARRSAPRRTVRCVWRA